MADATSSESASSDRPDPRPSSAGSPLDDLEGGDPLFDEEDPFGGENPFGGDDPFAGGDPFGGSFGNEPMALTVAKFWIRQNALLSVGLAFGAGTLIGLLKR